MQDLKDFLEKRQVYIYFIIVTLAIALSLTVNNSSFLKDNINFAIFFMMFVTFLQIPLKELAKSLKNIRFLLAILSSNFIFIPILVFVLLQFLPEIGYIKFAVALVLLAPCIDYVVTFSYLGRANSSSILVSTPILLLTQMFLLPIYLKLFVSNVGNLSYEPFLNAFCIFILIPVALAFTIQILSSKLSFFRKGEDILGVFPVLSTAAVLFIVIFSSFAQIKSHSGIVASVVPIYIAFSFFAPFIGFFVSKIFSLGIKDARAISFSSSTRNSLVVLPFANVFVDEKIIALVMMVIVTQTLVELVFELLYIKLIPKFIK